MTRSKASTTPAKVSSSAASTPTAEQTHALDAVLAFLPSSNAKDDEGLRLSLERWGQLTPILRQRGAIVDGRRRLAILTQLKKEPWIVDVDGVSGTQTAPDEAPALGHTYFESNVVRREIPLMVRAAMADALATLRKGDNQHTEAAGLSREDAARTVGVSADTLDRYRAIKADEEVCAKAMQGKMSMPQAVRVVRAKALAERAKSMTSDDGDIVAGLERLVLAGAQMSFILADVPTNYDTPQNTADWAPEGHYPTMSTDALKALRVDKVAAKDSLLWYWTPNGMLLEALEVIRAWGFTYVTSVVWAKPTGIHTNSAVSQYHETLLVAKRGQGVIHTGERMPSVYLSPALPRRRHSEKPAWFADQIDRLYPDVAKVELFARQLRPGWITLGNQVHVAVVAAPGATVAANDDALTGSLSVAAEPDKQPAPTVKKTKPAAAAATAKPAAKRK